VSDHPIHHLDDDVHQRVRLGILASLSSLARADFAHLKRTLDLTDGNLGRHLEVLEAAKLVTLTRERGDGRSRTWVAITRTGRTALRRELAALRQIIAHVDEAADFPTPDESHSEAARE
jgi:DNA-binding MarR family transcriptional regulator